VLDLLQPHLPPGVHVKLTPHTRWTTIQRADDGSTDIDGIHVNVDEDARTFSASGSAVRGLGAWIPFLPPALRRRLAAQDAITTIVSVAFAGLDAKLPFIIDGLTVEVSSTPEGVVGMYRLPDGSNSPVTLPPIPYGLL
jgi:hypothetical protein